MIFGAWRVRFGSLLPLVVTHVLINAAIIPTLKERYNEAIDRANVRPPTISRETTYLTEPLQKDGYPDYVAALNQRCSRGVTPQNNAAVSFWKAIGLSEGDKRYRNRHFQMLGIRPLPQKGDYFVDLETSLARRKNIAKRGGVRARQDNDDDAQKLLDRAQRRPWSERQFPALAEWLAANQKPLALLTEASERPRWYDPLVCAAKTPLIFVLEPAQMAFHHTGGADDALVLRAMLRLGEGNTEESWDDLMACHRLARLVGQAPTEVDGMVALRVQEEACAAELAFLQHARLTATQIAKMREDLDRLPPMSHMAEKIDMAERFTYLSNVLAFLRQGRRGALTALELNLDAMAALDLSFGSAAGQREKDLRPAIGSLRRYAASTTIDWDLVLRMGNSWFDRLTEACRMPPGAARRTSLDKLDAEFRRLRTLAADTALLDKAMTGDPRKALSQRLGQIMLSIFSLSSSPLAQMEARATMTFELTKLAFALAAYRADHGSYPAKLAQLAPKYAQKVPQDIFNDAELHFRPEGKGYCLYSVGHNGKDDGGKGFENGRRADKPGVDKDWDDMVVRMPSAAGQ